MPIRAYGKDDLDYLTWTSTWPEQYAESRIAVVWLTTEAIKNAEKNKNRGNIITVYNMIGRLIT